MKILFLNPSNDADSYYKKNIHFAELAAREFGIELAVEECHRDFSKGRAVVENLVRQSDPPDYVILVNDQNSAAEFLPLLTGAGINVFLAVEGFFVAEKLLLGKPRNKYPTWLGGLVPDDEQAGHLLGEQLIEGAHKRDLKAGDGRIHVVGLSGAYSAGSILRMNGLRAAIESHDNVVLEEVAPAFWEKEPAAMHTQQLLARHPETHVVWAASDDMALGALEAVKEAGRKPGEDILVGGIDWSPFAFEKVQSGEFEVSVGGHFLDGAWSIVMLYDHHNGVDFGADDVRSSYVVLTEENCAKYSAFFDESRWAGFRFSEFSKSANPERQAYDFGIAAVLDQLA